MPGPWITAVSSPPPEEPRPRRCEWRTGALLGGAYFLVGTLALMLAIHPGYATPLFPSAGIALGGLLVWGWRCWPGVFIAAFALAWLSSASSTDLPDTLLIAAGIATGASLQALAGAALIRRLIRFPNALADERDIIVFLIIGGPLACLISASLGVTTLVGTGVIPTSERFLAWWTWWIGDAIGVMIATPIMFVFCAQPRHLWRRRGRSVALPLLASALILIAIFGRSSTLEQDRVEAQFREQASRSVDAFILSIEVYLQSLRAVERFYTADEHVSRQEFRTFVYDFLQRQPEILALEWLPVIKDQEREDFEAQLRREGFSGFTITQRDARGVLVVAATRKEYVPVTYVEPYIGNERALGYDVASDPIRNEARIRARDTGKPAATAPIRLVQNDGTELGTLIFYPVYSLANHFNTIEARRRHITGFVLGAFRTRDLFGATFDKLPSDAIILRITDVTAPATQTVLFENTAANTSKQGAQFSWSDVIDLAGRDLLIEFKPTPDYIKAHRGWQIWAIPAGGLFFTALLGAFLLSITGRTEETQQLVDRQTLRLRSILENSIEAILTMDAHGRIESVNPAAERLFGYDSPKMLGEDINAFIPGALTHAGGLGLAGELLMDELGTVGRTREGVGLRRDGTTVPIEFSLSEVPLPERRLFTAIVHDLTERRKVDRLKSEFISAVSHELRTPLTSIRGSLGLIESGKLGKVNDKIMELVQIATNNCDRLVRLINDILDVERLEIGRVDFKFGRYEIAQLIESALQHNQGYTKAYGIKARLRHQPRDPVYVYVDADRLLQVMTNLISNAVKFSPEGGEVGVGIDELGDTVRVSITDEGPGVPEEFRERIFKKFAQADSSTTRARGGTGLGLSIVKTIIEKMGGSVGYESQTGAGATFYFTLSKITERRPEAEQRSD